jgi:hypothetical protein
MSKIGRNQPCPCGSGKKYKHCHGAFSAPCEFAVPREIVGQKFKELEAVRVRREQQQGLGRPIIATKFSGRRIVSVGDRLHWSERWHTFHDFLRDFFFGHLGKAWLDAEASKATLRRHRIMQWFYQATEDIKRSATADGEVFSAPMTGAGRAFLNLAYNIYLIAHHTARGGDRIVAGYVDRLKSVRSDDFTGALFETYAAAAFLKAGFTLEFENEKDGSISHVEFIPTYPKTGKKFSVEVKSRERAPADGVGGEMEVDDVKRLRVASKLNKALRKNAEHARVVMIEINVPEVVLTEEGWPASAMKQIEDNEKTDFPDGGEKPSAYVFVTNHAFHNNLSATDAGVQVLAAGFRIPDFGLDARPKSYKAVLEARERHCEMFALMKSMRTHYEIPSTFDGEIPELAFLRADGLPRLQFGQWYLVPAADGREVPGRLYDASVDEHGRVALGVYQLATGEHIVASCPMSEAELAAYKRYPDTFFGQERSPPRHSKSLVELCDFFYETYKDTPREKCLEWLAGAPDLDYLTTLSQKDLTIAFCERCALGVVNKPNANSGPGDAP